MSHYCIFLFFIVAFDPDQGISAFPLNDNGAIEKSNFSSEKCQAFCDFQRNGHYLRQEDMYHTYVWYMDMYHTYAKEEGTLKGDKMPATVHYVLGKGRARSVL